MRLVRRNCLTAALCGLTVTVLAAPASAAQVPISVAARTPNRVVTNEWWVTYDRAGFRTAAIHGDVDGVGTGAIARLYAERFPFTARLRAVASERLTPVAGRASFAFQVAPVLATRYRVEVFASAGSPTPMVISRALTIYVAARDRGVARWACGPTRCLLRLVVVRDVPPRSVPVEHWKHLFVYLSLVPWRSGPPPPAGTFHLVADVPVHLVVRGTVLRDTVVFQFRRPPYRWRTFWEACTRDRVALDGLGLTGHHGCGDARLRAGLPYVG